jgi:glycopeptide antibiotics resistance protein
VNSIHDQLIKLSQSLGVHLNDKQLHFIVIGLLGIVLFIVINWLFKIIAKYSITVLSFAYTLTVLVVVVFAIEIEQKITDRGTMEFQDIVQGLWGFIIAFAVYQGIRMLIRKKTKPTSKSRRKRSKSK